MRSVNCADREPISETDEVVNYGEPVVYEGSVPISKGNPCDKLKYPAMSFIIAIIIRKH